MPLWTVHHSADCLRPDDRRTLAEGITGIYSMLPSFYVGVVFQAAEPGALFIGGAPGSGSSGSRWTTSPGPCPTRPRASA